MDTKLVRLPKLSDRTGLPISWLKREADAGRLPYIRVGRARMFDPAAVLKAVADRQGGEVSRGK